MGALGVTYRSLPNRDKPISSTGKPCEKTGRQGIPESTLERRQSCSSGDEPHRRPTERGQKGEEETNLKGRQLWRTAIILVGTGATNSYMGSMVMAWDWVGKSYFIWPREKGIWWEGDSKAPGKFEGIWTYGRAGGLCVYLLCVYLLCVYVCVWDMCMCRILAGTFMDFFSAILGAEGRQGEGEIDDGSFADEWGGGRGGFSYRDLESFNLLHTATTT